MTRSVVVLGGGAAGLAAAVGHHARGWQVTLVEARRHLGGRAWSFSDSGLGADLDNGPHVILGCYRAFRRLLRALGSEHLFFRPPGLQLTWLDPGGRLRRLRPPPLPAPLHLVWGLLAIEGLTAGERTELLLAGCAPFLRLPSPLVSVSEWTRRGGYDGVARRLMFEPLCRAVMNDEPERSDAALFLATLREAFRGGRAASAMWLPKAPWGDILDRPARSWCARTGTQLLLGTRVRALEPGTRAPAVRLEDGRVLNDHGRVVVALPWSEATRLDAGGCVAPRAGELRPSPLVSVHLSLPAGSIAFSDPVVAFVDGQPFHFLCRRASDSGAARPDVPACLLAGGATDLDGQPARDIVATALAQLALYLGRRDPWPARTVESATVLREPRATFAHLPGSRSARPRPGASAWPGLWLAGDFTDTGLPATLEGAARSGFDPLDRDGEDA